MNVLIYVLAVLTLLLIGKFFLVPIKILTKLVINALIGGIVLFLINYIGGFFSVHIAFNAINAVIIGILGIPGVILLLVL